MITFFSFYIIGIYPEWNVKTNDTTIVKLFAAIGIYPEWNVKELKLELKAHNANWNISRMECKVKTIRVISASLQLEYIQNGM